MFTEIHMTINPLCGGKLVYIPLPHMLLLDLSTMKVFNVNGDYVGERIFFFLNMQIFGVKGYRQVPYLQYRFQSFLAQLVLTLTLRLLCSFFFSNSFCYIWENEVFILKIWTEINPFSAANEFLSQGLKRWACPLPGSRYAVSMRGGTPPDNQ